MRLSHERVLSCLVARFISSIHSPLPVQLGLEIDNVLEFVEAISKSVVTGVRCELKTSVTQRV